MVTAKQTITKVFPTTRSILPAGPIPNVLPTVIANLAAGIETNQFIADTRVYCSIYLDASKFREKAFIVQMTEAGAVGNPVVLLWIDLGFYYEDIGNVEDVARFDNARWGALGGGQVGGVPPTTFFAGVDIPPVSPVTVVPVGNSGSMQILTLPWSIHSQAARLMIWPQAAAPALQGWWVAAHFVARE